MPVPKVRSLVPLFGTNRTLAEVPGLLLKGCAHVTIPFFGGGSEVWYIDAPTIVASDLHRHIINLALVVQDDKLRKALATKLSRTIYHPNVLRLAQKRCQFMEGMVLPLQSEEPNIDWAYDYYVASWLARSGCAGTKGEFTASYSIRYSDGGGDSNTRFRSAVASLEEWSVVSQKITYDVLPWREALARGKDDPKNGKYLDSPFVGTGKNYRHSMTDEEIEEISKVVSLYQESPIVVRAYDHKLIRQWYPKKTWTWHEFAGRTQANKDSPEVFITRRCRMCGTDCSGISNT